MSEPYDASPPPEGGEHDMCGVISMAWFIIGILVGATGMWFINWLHTD